MDRQTEEPRSDQLAPEKIHRCGTLRYTSRGVLVLFLWLLGGDFAFMFFESIFGRFIPLYLKDLEASNTLIGVMTGSFAGLVNILFLPNISQWSDGYRSRIGRRIPFLYIVAPLTVLSLTMVGYAPEIARWLQARIIMHVAPGASEASIVLTLLCVLIVSFHFFNMTLVNSYNWLLRDVVPQELMPRFLSWFRVVGMLGTFAFLWFVFPHMATYRKEVFLGVGIFYLAVFLLMCWHVKEGEYPPPPQDKKPGVVQSFALYFRECLSIPLYRNFFITAVLVIVAVSCASPFTTLFMRSSLGLSMDDVGKAFAWGAAASTLSYFPVGWLCEKYTPIRVVQVNMLALILTSVLAFFLVHDQATLIAYSVIFAIPTVGWSLGSLTLTMQLFPKEKFGQFSSGLNVFGCGALILGNYLMGKFMDVVGSDYRMTFLWSAVFFALACVPMRLVYQGWKNHGGSLAYVPPLPDEQRTQSP